MPAAVATYPGMLAADAPTTDLPDLDEAALAPWLARPGVGLLDFTARWCGPCKQLTPIVAALAARYRGRVRFAVVDVEAAPVTVAALRVVSMPTMVLVRDGAAVGRLIGVRPAAYIAGALDRALGGAVAIAGP